MLPRTIAIISYKSVGLASVLAGEAANLSLVGYQRTVTGHDRSGGCGQICLGLAGHGA